MASPTSCWPKASCITTRWRSVGWPRSIGTRSGTVPTTPVPPGPGSYVLTDDDCGSFELSFEWKVTPGANSGVMYRVAEEKPDPGLTGPEYQVLDNKRHPDGRSKLTAAASCYGMYAPSQDATKPV